MGLKIYFSTDLLRVCSEYLTILRYVSSSPLFARVNNQLENYVSQYVEIYHDYVFSNVFRSKSEDWPAFTPESQHLVTEIIWSCHKSMPSLYVYHLVPNVQDLVNECIKLAELAKTLLIEPKILKPKKCIKKYKKFFKKISDTDKMILPTKEIYFVWRAHLTDIDNYVSDSIRYANKLIDHNGSGIKQLVPLSWGSYSEDSPREKIN